jgi:hypothetical protein
VFLRNETRAKFGFVSYVSISLCFDFDPNNRVPDQHVGRGGTASKTEAMYIPSPRQRYLRMETRLTFLLMILAQSVLPKVSGIWVQLSTIRSHRMLTSTIGSPKPRQPLAL